MLKKIIGNFGRFLVNLSISKDVDTEAPFLVGGARLRKSPSRAIAGNPMSFNVFSASGGKVIEFERYDHIKDYTYRSLYVIANKDDLAEELSEILVKEALIK
jgi:hypothetical protein